MRFYKWLTSFTASSLLFWWWMMALVLGSCAFGLVLNAEAGSKINYINKDTASGEDHVTTSKFEWAFFIDINTLADKEWTYVDLQRDVLIYKQTTLYEGNYYPSCLMYVAKPGTVELAQYGHTLEKLVIEESGIIGCKGVEDYIKKELR